MAPHKSTPARKSMNGDIFDRRQDLNGSVRKKGRQRSLDYDGVVCAFCGKRVSRSNVSHHMKGFHNFDFLRNREEGRTGWHDQDGKKILDLMYFEENDLNSTSESVYTEVLQCLEPGRWLTDAALETIVKFYVRRDYPEKKIELLPIALSKAWKDGFVDKPSLSHAKPDIVVAILHSDRAGGHWSCLFLDLNSKTFAHLDSMEEWHNRQALDFGRSYLRSLNMEQPYFFKELSCGLQVNDFDCGIHVITNIRKGLDQLFCRDGDICSIQGVASVDSSRLRRQIRKDMGKELEIKLPQANAIIVDLTPPKTPKKQKRQCTQIVDKGQIQKAPEPISKVTGSKLQCCACSEWFPIGNLKLSKRQVSFHMQKKNFRCSACKAFDGVKSNPSLAIEVTVVGEKAQDKEFRPANVLEAVEGVGENDDNLPVAPKNLAAKSRPMASRRSPRYSRDMRNLHLPGPNVVTSEDGFKMETSTPHHVNLDDQTFESELEKSSGPSSPASDTTQPRVDRSNDFCSVTFSCPQCCYKLSIGVGSADSSAARNK